MGAAEGVRVVVVDDDEDIRMLLRVHFRRDGRFDVVGEAGDCAQALVLCKELEPDVVVLDVRLPDGDGLSVLSDIRSCAGSVVIFTAYAEMIDVSQAEEWGAGAVFDKGVPLTTLADRMVTLAAAS